MSVSLLLKSHGQALEEELPEGGMRWGQCIYILARQWRRSTCMFLSSYHLSKPAKQVWYWASRLYKSRMTKFRVYVCVCNYSSQTTEPICIKIIPANRAFYADCYRLFIFQIFIPPLLHYGTGDSWSTRL